MSEPPISGWQPIETVPRDGRYVWLRHADAGMFPMRWSADDSNPLVSTQQGIWVLKGGGLTWCDEVEGGGPDEWAPYYEH